MFKKSAGVNLWDLARGLLVLTPFFIFFIPIVSFSAGLITCVDIDNCRFNDIISTVQNIINFLAIYISVPVATIMFAWAGGTYLFAGGNESRIKKAHNIFINVLVGFLIVISAWLIINTIANALLDTAKFETYLK